MERNHERKSPAIRDLSRREMLDITAAAAAAALAGCGTPVQPPVQSGMTSAGQALPLQAERRASGMIYNCSTMASGETTTPSCMLTPELTEGPFYLDLERVRKDITEGKSGVPL